MAVWGGGWGGGSNLDLIFPSEVYWPQNDSGAFHKPIKRLWRRCSSVTLTALKEADGRTQWRAGGGLSARMLPCMYRHTCGGSDACTVTHAGHVSVCVCEPNRVLYRQILQYQSLACVLITWFFVMWSHRVLESISAVCRWDAGRRCSGHQGTSPSLDTHQSLTDRGNLKFSNHPNVVHFCTLNNTHTQAWGEHVNLCFHCSVKFCSIS